MKQNGNPGPDEKRLELAMEAAEFDLWENDLLAGTVTRKATKIFAELGYAEDETADFIDDIFAIIDPDDVALVKTALSEHLSGASARYRCEFRVRAKTGEWIWYANHGKIMDRDQDQPGRRFIGITFNIDEVKRADARAQAAEPLQHRAGAGRK